jgi:uncharacterized protein
LLFTYSATLLAWLRAALLLFLLAVLPACAGRSYYTSIDRALEAGRPTDGIAVLEQHQSSYGSRSEVLYLMDLGMLQHLAGEFQASNRSLAKAEDLTETLYTRRVSSEAAAFLTTDNALPYEGEEFEKVMLNVIMAMNYAQLGLLDDALVEARKVDHKLSVLNDRNGGKIAYSKDPFARYLSGILYESQAQTNDALVAYRLAFDAFQQAQRLYGTTMPDLLRRDLLRLTEALGLREEHEEYRKLFPGISWQPVAQTKDLAELIFVAYEGRAPLKRDVFIDVPFSRDALGVVLVTKGLGRSYPQDHRGAESILYGLTGHIIRLAVPTFVPRRSTIIRAEAAAIANDIRHTDQLVLMEDITSIAVKDLEQRIVRTTTKAVARAAWKYAAAEGVAVGVRNSFGKNNEAGHLAGVIAGVLARTLAIASEEADKRSWATLPDRIQVGRVVLPPGTYDIEFRYVNRRGDALPTQIVPRITVAAGQKRFVTTRVVQ